VNALSRLAAIAALSVSLPAFSNAVLNEARAHLNDGRNQQALSVLDAQLARSPQDAEARFLRGLALSRLGRTDAAISAFSDLTRDYPQLPEPYNNLAVLYAQQGDYEKARSSLEAALATHPSYATAHENLGDIYSALASASYNRALTLDQDNTALRQKLRLMDQMNALPMGAAPASTRAAPQPLELEPLSPSTPTATASAPRSGEPTPEVAESISRAIYEWSVAWQTQDVGAYLASYANNFTPEGGLSRTAWEAQRRDRVSSPGSITLRVVDPTIRLLDDGRARVTFRQEYQSDSFRNVTSKTLELRSTNGRWLIVREYTS
jgi:tetratricopeptide (TPR) repeat protein